MASTWFFKKLRQAWKSCDPERFFTMYFLTVEQAVANAELSVQLQGYAILPILWMIGRYSPNEFNVFLRNCWSTRLALRFPPPELP
jgi:hypothetical protein